MCVADKGCVLAGGRPFPVAMEGGVDATTACDRTYMLMGAVVLQAPAAVEINISLLTPGVARGPRPTGVACTFLAGSSQ